MTKHERLKIKLPKIEPVQKNSARKTVETISPPWPKQEKNVCILFYLVVNTSLTTFLESFLPQESHFGSLEFFMFLAFWMDFLYAETLVKFFK